MGTVYEALHETIERRAAVKVLSEDLARDGEYVERFLNEARAVNLIAHPGVVQIYDFGSLPEGTTFLVMELLIGQTLGQRLKQHGGRLPLAEAVAVALEAATALQAAHGKQVVHRDLKPDNIFLLATSGAKPQIKLLDFGVAKVAKSANASKSGSQTVPGAVLGTPCYMSPEQIRDTSQADAQSDVYSLGVVLFQMACGRLPFIAASSMDLMAKHLLEPPPTVSSLLLEAPRSLERLVGAMLSKAPDERPTMLEVTEQLERIAAKLPAGVAAQWDEGSAADSGHETEPPAADSTLRKAASQQGERSQPSVPVHKSGRRVARYIGWVAAWLAIVSVTALYRRSMRKNEKTPAAIVTPASLRDLSQSEAKDLSSAEPDLEPPPPDLSEPVLVPPPPPPDLAEAEAPPERCHLIRPNQRCVVLPANAPHGLAELVFRSLVSADLRVCTRHPLRLYRLNRGMSVRSTQAHVDLTAVEQFSASLQGLLGRSKLPEQIVIQCPR